MCIFMQYILNLIQIPHSFIILASIFNNSLVQSGTTLNEHALSCL